MTRAATEVRREHVRSMYLERGLSVPQIVRELRKLKVITTRRNDSAERLVRSDIAAIDAELTVAKAANSSDFARARYRMRLERIFEKGIAEFEQREGVTVTEGRFVYPGGKEMTMTSTRRGDRGGQRIRALQVAMRASDALAKLDGIVDGQADPAPADDQRPYRGLIVDLSECDEEHRRRIEESERAFAARLAGEIN